jgi:hypothetical protein
MIDETASFFTVCHLSSRSVAIFPLPTFPPSPSPLDV